MEGYRSSSERIASCAPRFLFSTWPCTLGRPTLPCRNSMPKRAQNCSISLQQGGKKAGWVYTAFHDKGYIAHRASVGDSLHPCTHPPTPSTAHRAQNSEPLSVWRMAGKPSRRQVWYSWAGGWAAHRQCFNQTKHSGGRVHSMQLVRAATAAA